MAKAPKVKAITRKGNKFTFAWDQQESSITDQQAYYTLNYSTVKGNAVNAYINASKNDLDVGKSTKQKTVTINLASYNGDTKTLQSVNFFVRGKYKDKNKKEHWTGWSSAVFDIKIPSVTLVSEHTSTNATKFTWNCAEDNTGHKPANDVIYQTILVKDCPVSKAADFRYLEDWRNASNQTKPLSGSYTQTETGLGSDSYTRIVRVRARGAGGSSAGMDGSTWKYASYCYGTPYAAENLTATARQSSEGINVDCTFNNPNDAAHRISKVYIEYNIATPLANMVAPSSGWETGWTLKDTSQNKAEHVVFDILGASIEDDKVLFLRVKNEYGDRVETSDPIVAQGGYGSLTDPSITATPNETQETVQITATNNSAVPGSYLLITALWELEDHGIRRLDLGTIEGSGQHTVTYQNVKRDEWGGMPKAYEAQARALSADGLLAMLSKYVRTASDMPSRPEISVEPGDRVGVAHVTWDWDWDEADQMEISWSEYEHAWESTDEPDAHLISKVNASELYITGLETGQPIYIRGRYVSGYNDEAIYGTYSETQTIILESAPDIPSLELSRPVIPAYGETKASWVYVSKDGTEQSKAQICEWDAEEEKWGDPIVEVEGDQFANISGDNWETGTTHLLGVRVWSSKGQPSEWSETVALTIAEPITCTIASTSLVEEEIDIGDNDTRECLSLKEMPLEVNVSGVGESGGYRVVIKRAAPYRVPRPDNNMFDGYEGETIGIFEQTGNGAFIIDASDNMMFDDDGTYVIEATATDSYGQTDTTTMEFEVHWTVQALMPTATVTMAGNVAIITPRAEAQTGATCDIYRLSADKPQRILTGGTFGNVYVDPYPAIGQHGGYRIVFRTANGDYTTAQGKPAWYDVSTNLVNDKTIIDFNGESVELYYNVDESNGWQKDFVQTKYLGGAVQGDWNVGVTQNGSLNAVAITLLDQDMIDAMRRLANWAGVCHVRTLSGASYAADVQVSESIGHDKGKLIYNYSLTITKVDPIGDEAIPYNRWANQ